MHVLLPDVYACMAPECSDVVNEGLEQAAEAKMQRIGSRPTGLSHETIKEWGPEVWPTVQQVMSKNNIDLVVLGTHGRTAFKGFC